MTILVTGGTGLVGSRVLKRLVEAGIDCRALVRPGKELPAGVTAIEGDILNPESLAAAVEGISAIDTVSLSQGGDCRGQRTRCEKCATRYPPASEREDGDCAKRWQSQHLSHGQR